MSTGCPDSCRNRAREPARKRRLLVACAARRAACCGLFFRLVSCAACSTARCGLLLRLVRRAASSGSFCGLIACAASRAARCGRFLVVPSIKIGKCHGLFLLMIVRALSLRFYCTESCESETSTHLFMGYLPFCNRLTGLRPYSMICI